MAAFDKNKIGEIRPNQLITTFGPGAIIDAVRDSVTVLDTNHWVEKGKRIIDGRLASYLNVNCFFMPKTTGKSDVPIVSFPYTHICSFCGRIFDIRDYFDEEKYKFYGATCPDCQRQAYPSRFIVMCEKGHMDDFPWSWWVHDGDSSHKNHRLRLYSTGNTSTLADMRVECLDCKKSRSLSGATQPERFAELKCTGRHPFRPHTKNEKCSEGVIPSQRGASNVYFPVIRSAISIPPWTDPIYNMIDVHLREIEQTQESLKEIIKLQPHMAESMPDAETVIFNKYFLGSFSREEYDKALERRRKNIKEFTEIKLMEYKAITHHDDPAYASNKKHFKTEEEPVPASLKPYFSKVIKITRLRDVMVLLGFTRVVAPDPESESQNNIVRLNREYREPWLPAVEINGEGIFIELNKEAVNSWLAIPSVSRFSAQFEKSYDAYCTSREWTQSFKRNGKYVLLHTLSHLLIKEMSLQSGYSSSAIKERIYASDEMCGILLYTGSADKEGSLGGLVELGNYDKLTAMLKGALENAMVCTNDPECMFNTPTSEKIQGASCHSCCMISETACEIGNRLLDRGFIVPLPNREEQAFFRRLVNDLCHLEV